MKKLTLIFAAFGLAAFSAQAWAETERVDVVDATMTFDDGDGLKLVSESANAGTESADGEAKIESSPSENLPNDKISNSEVENFASLRAEDAAGTEKLVDDGSEKATSGDVASLRVVASEHTGDRIVADPKVAGDKIVADPETAGDEDVAAPSVEGNADEVVVIDENVDNIEKSETAMLIDEALEELEREDAARHWNGAGTENVATSSAGTDFTIFGKTFHVDPTKSHAPLVEPVDLMPLVDKRVRLVLPDVDGTVTKKKSGEETIEKREEKLVNDGNSNSEVKNFASLSAGTISTANSAGTVKTAGTRSFFSVSSGTSSSAGTVFYSTATVSLTNAQTISDNSTGTDSGDSTGTDNSTGTTEKTLAEKNAEVLASITNKTNTITASTIATNISNGISALGTWNKNSLEKDCSFQGYPFFPTDFDFFADEYQNILWYYKKDTLKRAPDYIFNPVTVGFDDAGTSITRYDSDKDDPNRKVIENPHSDKRYYYFIDRFDKTTNETLRGVNGALWAQFYPFGLDENGNAIDTSTYRLITGDTSEIFQTVGSVIVIEGGLGSFPETNTRLLDVYNAVLNGSLADKDSAYNSYFKKLTVHTPVVYLSGIDITGTSYIILEGDDTSLVFQKTENDRQYNELTVPIYFKGVLDFANVRSIVINDNVLINKKQDKNNGTSLEAQRTTTKTMTSNQSAPILIFGGALEGGKGKNIYIEYSNVIFKGECSAYEGDWYFAYGSNVVFAYATQTNNPIGVGDFYFRKSSWTLSTYSDNLQDRNIYAQISNDIILDGGSDSDYSLRIFESGQKRVFNESTNTFNRSYKILSGNISEGPRGATEFVWGDRTEVPDEETTEMYQNMTLIFTGDNSGFGVFAKESPDKDANGYTTSKVSWRLGKTAYNMEKLGGINAMPFIFGDGSAFTITKKDKDGKEILDDNGNTILNYAAIAGYGAFGTGDYNGSGALTETDYVGVGFQYKSDVVVGNAFLGNIRLVNLDSGTIKLTNVKNELKAGIWVTGGGKIEVEDLAALGKGSLNLLAGTLIYTGSGDATFSKTIANKSSVFEYYNKEKEITEYYCDTQSGAWGIEVTDANATLHWDATGLEGSNYDTLERNVRENDFTKTGKGTLEITNGNLIEPSTSGRDYIGGTKKYYANVYLKEGTLKLSGNATLGATQTLYMQGGSLVADHDITVNTTKMTYSTVTDSNGLSKYYDYNGVLFSYNTTLTGAEYQTALEDAGLTVLYDLALSYTASGQNDKQAFTYNGKVLYYNDGQGYVVVGRERIGTGSTFQNMTDLTEILKRLNNSYIDSSGTTKSALYGTLDGVTDISKLVFNYNGQLVTGLTQLADGSVYSKRTQETEYSTVLQDSTISSSSTITFTIPQGQIVEDGTIKLDSTGNITNLIVDSSFDTATLDEKFSTTSEVELSRSIYLSAVKNQTAHNISINSGAGTLTLAGGKMTIEFTYFGKNEDGTNYETESFNGVTRPSYTYLNLDGKFEVTAESELELTFSNKAVLSRGVYLLVDAGETISEESIANLKLTGIIADNDLATRQTISLLRGDKQKVIDVLNGTVESSNVDTTARSSTGTTFTGDDSQLYLYITPGSAILYWNTTNNAWAQHENEQNLQDNWKFQDDYSLENYEGKTDTNFYANDMVYFSDVERTFKEGEVDADGNQRQDIKIGSTHTVYIEGSVHPLQMVVDAEQDNYIFKSVTDTEKGKDKKTGCIDGAVTLVKEGAGTLTIYTTNSYTGGTEITKGTVNALAKQALGTGTVIVTEDGVLNVGAAGMNTNRNGYVDENRNAFAPVEGVLYGSIQLDVRGTVNIYASSNPDESSTVSIGKTGGGILNAYAANAMGSVAVSVSGGELHAFVGDVFNGNVVTVRGSDETNQGIKAKIFAESTGSLNNATFDVWGDGVIYAKAKSIGNAKDEDGNVGTIINLYGNTRADYRPGMIVIAANNALDGIEKVSFNMGGVIKVEQGEYDISEFTNWEWQSATGAEIKVGDASAIADALTAKALLVDGQFTTDDKGNKVLIESVATEIAEQAANAAKDSSLTISSTNMVAASTKIIHKTGTGTLVVNMDFQTGENATTKFMGDFYFDDDTNLDGRVVFDFGSTGTAKDHLTYAGTLKGKGAEVEFTGTCGEVNETYAHWFENTRVVNMTDVKDASGNKISNGTLYANETLIYMSTKEIKALKYCTRFDSGDLVLQALPTENGAYRIGNIITSTADSRYDVEIKSVNAHGYIVASQNLCDGTFDGKFVNNTVAVTTTNSDGTTTTTNETYNISIDKYGTHELTLANNNSSTGTLHIYEGTVQIGNGGLTGDWAGDIIADADTELHFNFAKTLEDGKTLYVVELFGGTDTTTFSGDGKIVFENGNFKLYNSSAFEAMAGTDGHIVIESGASVIFDYSSDVAAGTSATLNGDASVMLIAGGVNLYENENIAASETFSGTLILAGISNENVVKVNSDDVTVTIDKTAEYSAFIDNSFNTDLLENDDTKLTTDSNTASGTKTDITKLFPDLVENVDSVTNTEYLGLNSGNENDGNENSGNGEASARAPKSKCSALPQISFRFPLLAQQ